jgi:colanic acid/amylovoran biosynthesis glycosyltransferase
MKIALIANTFPVKQETFIVEKAVRLTQIGQNEVVVFAQHKADPGYFKEQIASAKNLNVVELFGPEWKFSRKLFTLFLAVISHPIPFFMSWYKLLKIRQNNLGCFLHYYPIMLFNPDILHIEFMDFSPTYIGLLRVLTSCMKVASCRGTDIDVAPITNPVLVDQYREVFSLVNKVHCVSKWVKEIAVQRFGCPADNIEVIQSSVNIQFFKCEPDNRNMNIFTIGTVSRLHWEKGHIYAIKAIKYLKNIGLKVTYIIVGDGVERESLLYDIYDLGLEEQVKIMPWMRSTGVRDFLKTIDVFLLPSISEGFGNAAVEAMSMSKPVIVTDTGCSETIDHGIEGLVVPKRNSIAIAQAIKFYYDNPVKRDEMGRAARKRVERDNTVENQIEAFSRLYSLS